LTLGPPPRRGLRAKLATWPAGQAIHRVQGASFAPDGFNPCLGRPSRFAPITDARGRCVPSLYGARSFETALFETFFRNISQKSVRRRVYASDLALLAYSVLEPQVDLVLVDLASTGLHWLEITPEELFGGSQRTYAKTVAWARELFLQTPRAQGLVWMSKRNNRDSALVLYKPRIARGALTVSQPASSLLDAPLVARVREAAASANITLIEP